MFDCKEHLTLSHRKQDIIYALNPPQRKQSPSYLIQKLHLLFVCVAQTAYLSLGFVNSKNK